MKSITVQRIEQLIKQEDETPNSFAKKVGITANSVYNLLDGGQPRKSTITKICQAYPKYTEDWLLGSDAIHINASDKFEIDRLREENKWLKGVINTLQAQLGKAGNFNDAPTKAGAGAKVVTMFTPVQPVRVGVNA